MCDQITYQSLIEDCLFWLNCSDISNQSKEILFEIAYYCQQAINGKASPGLDALHTKFQNLEIELQPIRDEQ